MEETPLIDLAARFQQQVVALGPSGNRQRVGSESKRTEFLTAVGARICFLTYLASLGWADPPNKYLTEEDAEPHLVHQKVNALFVSGLHQQSPSARKLLSARFGPVPYVGPPFAPRAWIEESCHDSGHPLLLPDGALETFLAQAGPEGFLGALVPFLPPNGVPTHSTHAPTECLAEVARILVACRILSDSPDLQPLPDLTQLVKVAEGTPQLPPEDHTNEYKSTYEFDRRTGTRNPSHAIATLKTVCAFLNSQGGTLTIGVDDQLTPIGLEGDFSLIKDPNKQDMFESRLREAVKNHIEPLPLGRLKVSFPSVSGTTLCRLDVDPNSDTVTYLVHKDPTNGQPLEEVFVRDGNRTLSLKGRKRDQFVLSRADRPGTIAE